MAGFLRFEFLMPPVEAEIKHLWRQAHGVSFWFRHRKASIGLLGKATSSCSRHIFSARRRSALQDWRVGTADDDPEVWLGFGPSSKQKNRMSIDDMAELMPNRLSMLARGVSQSTQFVPRIRPRGARKARGLRDEGPFGGPNEKRAAKARVS